MSSLAAQEAKLAASIRGATTVVDYKTTRFEEAVPPMDVVIETVRGDTRDGRSGSSNRAVARGSPRRTLQAHTTVHQT